MSDRTFTIIAIIFFLVLAIMIGACIWETSYLETKTEVESYTVGCEITRIDYGEVAGKSTAYHKPFYKMGVRCDDFATTLDITEEDFAKYSDDDIVEIQVVVYEYRDGVQVTEYTLLGLQQ